MEQPLSDGMATTLPFPNEVTPLISNPKLVETDIYEPTMKDALQEIKILLSSAIPNSIAYFLQSSMSLVSVSSIGHLGSKQLGAAALSNMFAAITCWSLSVGMSSCLDTLCSQSFTGGKDPHHVGLHMQRGILVSLLIFSPISIVWWNFESIFLSFGQDPELASLCGVFLRILLLGVPPVIIFECIKKFLQAQKIMKAQTYITVTVIPIYLLLNYILVINPSTSIGFVGAPLASVINYWLVALLGWLYVMFIDGYQCWGGFSSQALTNWGIYFKLGIPGIFQVCSEWWAFEIMALSTLYLGTDELAAHSVATSISTSCFSIAFGQGTAISNRIGNLFGAGFPNRAKLTSRCAILLSLILPNISVIILMLFKNQIPWFFTDEQGAVDVLKGILPIVAIYQIFDSINAVCNGIMRGQGRQKVGAIANIFAFYVLAIPLGLYAAFKLNLSVLGLWLGNSLASIIVGITLIAIILRIDWVDQVNLCKNRLNQSYTNN